MPRKPPTNFAALRLYSIRQFCERTGLGYTKVAELIRSGELRALKMGPSTVKIPIEAIEAWEASFPTVA